MQARCVDDSIAQWTGLGTAYLRALESSREDRIVHDPFAERLTQYSRVEMEKLLHTEQNNSWGDMIAIRSRYVDEALENRDVGIHQIVILGAGLDTRAYRLESLRGCHVLEIEQSPQAFDRKREVLKEDNAPPIAEKIDYIVANLADDDWDDKLLGRGFNTKLATFWVMEGLIPYFERSDMLTLVDTVDAISAPGSELWADVAGDATFGFPGTGTVKMKHSENDPLRGVLSSIPWCLKIQASLKNEGVHFGRKWTPLTSVGTSKNVPISFILGKKPVPTEAWEKDVCPGLEC